MGMGTVAHRQDADGMVCHVGGVADGPRPLADDRREQIVSGALACVAELGVPAMTVDDIARVAGCSRATVYRLFPGGKEAILGALADREVERCLEAVGAAVDASEDLRSALVGAVSTAGRLVAEHPVLARLLQEEPDLVLPLLAFEHQGRILGFVGQWAVPKLDRWLDAGPARRVGEWAARLVASYGLDPTTRSKVADETWVAHMVDAYLLPGIAAMCESAGAAADGGDRPGGPGRRGGIGGHDGTCEGNKELCHERSHA
jgi:AcrR family transcriptional regulator